MWLCLQSAPYKSDLWTLFNAQRGISQLLGDKSKYKNSNEQMTLWFALTLPPLTSPYNTIYIYVPMSHTSLIENEFELRMRQVIFCWSANVVAEEEKQSWLPTGKSSQGARWRRKVFPPRQSWNSLCFCFVCHFDSSKTKLSKNNKPDSSSK